MTSETRPDSKVSRFGEIRASQAELRESLLELIGAEVALGRCANSAWPTMRDWSPPPKGVSTGRDNHSAANFGPRSGASRSLDVPSRSTTPMRSKPGPHSMKVRRGRSASPG